MSTTDTPYELMGGDAAVRALVDRFYDLMDTAPEAATVRRMHAASLKQSREKLYEFLSGWLGGPQLYVAKRGHPMLRARHLPFSIGAVERDEWMWCMERAIADQPMPEALRAMLLQRFADLATHMRNRADETPPDATGLPII